MPGNARRAAADVGAFDQLGDVTILAIAPAHIFDRRDDPGPYRRPRTRRVLSAA
jgi:hypothetical protein